MEVAETGLATWDDVATVALNIREEERSEIEAATGMHPLPALVISAELSALTHTTKVCGETLCIWGVQETESPVLGERHGSVWLISTDAIERHPRAFWKECLAHLPRLFDSWDVLTNAIDVRHEKAIRWAERLGFQLEPPAPYGVEGLPFRKFSLRKEHLKCARQ